MMAEGDTTWWVILLFKTNQKGKCLKIKLRAQKLFQKIVLYIFMICLKLRVINIKMVTDGSIISAAGAHINMDIPNCRI